MNICTVRAKLFHAGGRTDRTKLNHFSQFCKVPKKEQTQLRNTEIHSNYCIYLNTS